MTTEQPTFTEAMQVFVRALVAHKAKRPRTNLLKCVWLFVHETSPQYQQTLDSGALSVTDGFALARGARRPGWSDQFPKEALVCLIGIGDSQRAFPARVHEDHVHEDLAGRELDALRAIFDGAPEEEQPSVLRRADGRDEHGEEQ